MLDAGTEGGWEGCLSVPGLRGWVERPAHIRYRGFGAGRPDDRADGARLSCPRGAA